MSLLHLDLTLVAEVISFLIFFWLLNMILYQPLSAIFRQRAERINAGLRAAEESERHAAETQRQVRQILDEVRNEAQSTINAATREAAARRQELLAQARAQADRLTAQAEEELRQERQAAVEALQREVITLAILAAGRVTGVEVDTPRNRELASQVLVSSGGLAAGTG